MAERTPNKQGLESVIEIIEQVCGDICDNYCMYKDTVDEECLCDVTRNGGRCPLDRLIQDFAWHCIDDVIRTRRCRNNFWLGSDYAHPVRPEDFQEG